MTLSLQDRRRRYVAHEIAAAAMTAFGERGFDDVTVDEIGAVRRSQRGCRLLAEGNHLVGAQRPPCLCQILLQRLAVQQLHDQIRPPILLTGVEDGANVGMA